MGTSSLEAKLPNIRTLSWEDWCCQGNEVTTQKLSYK